MGYDMNTVFEEMVEVQKQVESLRNRDFDGEARHSDSFQRGGAIDRITEIALDEEKRRAAVCARLWAKSTSTG